MTDQLIACVFCGIENPPLHYCEECGHTWSPVSGSPWINFRERRPGFICEVMVYWQLLQMDRAMLTIMQYRPDRDVWISRSGHEYGSDEYIGFLFWLPLPAPPTQEQVERAKQSEK